MKHSHCQYKYSDLSQYQLIECRKLLEVEELTEALVTKRREIEETWENG